MTGCASVGRVTSDSENLAKDECLVLMMVFSPRGWITISPAGTDPTNMMDYQRIARTVEVNADSDLMLLKIKQGSGHRISRFQLREFQSVYLDLSKTNLSFSCRGNEITYIGDITFKAIKINGATLKDIKVSITDNEAISKKFASEKYPKLFEKYSYHKNMIHKN
jgi:hypothetical protein